MEPSGVSNFGGHSIYPSKAHYAHQDLKAVLSYGKTFSSVFHQYMLSTDRTADILLCINTHIDATLATLSQVSSLFKDESSGQRFKPTDHSFNEDGLIYVKGLILECAKTLKQIEFLVVDATKQQRRKPKPFGTRDAKARAEAIKNETEIVFEKLELDEKIFLTCVECVGNMMEGWAQNTFDECGFRLYDLQMRLLLVFQIGSVGVLSKDLSAGKVDVNAIVTVHERAKKTAKLVGIKAPGKRSKWTRDSSDDSGSSSDSNTDSGSSSDASEMPIGKSKALPRFIGFSAPPPPPPAIAIASVAPPTVLLPLSTPSQPHPGFTLTQQSVPPSLPPAPPPFMLGPHRQLSRSTDSTNPPSYTESPKTPKPSSKKVVRSPTLLGIQSTLASCKGANEKATPSETSGESTESEFKDKKVEEVKPTALEPRLFKSKSHGFTFKLRTMFQSKHALAAEMQKALSDADSHLLAFVIRKEIQTKVPHSAFHSLEATHMRTILSQLNDDTWFKNFTSLDCHEQRAIEKIMYPWAKGSFHERQIVALKVVKEEPMPNAWMTLTKDIRRSPPSRAPMSGGRTLLAIVREQFVNGEPLFPKNVIVGTCVPPPPPPPPGHLEYHPSGYCPRPFGPFSPAPKPVSSNTTSNFLPPGHPGIMQPSQISKGPLFTPSAMRPPGPPPVASPMRVSDITALNDHEAALALTSYNYYIMRPCQSNLASIPKSWLHVTETLKPTDKDAVRGLVSKFQASGGSVVKASHILTKSQADQVTHLLATLRFAEKDPRFEWSWVLISLFDCAGDFLNVKISLDTRVSEKVVSIHLAAKRSLKGQYKPAEVYKYLHPIPPPSIRPPPPLTQPHVPATTLAPAPPPFAIIDVKRPKAKNRSSNSASSDSRDTSEYDSCDSRSSAYMRRRRESRLRRRGVRIRGQAKGRVGRGRDESDDDDEEDVINVKIKVRRGEDVVEKLLEMWTPQVGEVKEKERALA